jgi:hypothetical protein
MENAVHAESWVTKVKTAGNRRRIKTRDLKDGRNEVRKLP